MKTIAIWGQFGETELVADGQAVRTRTITEVIEEKFYEDRIYKVNSFLWKKSPLSLLVKTIKMWIISRYLVILPADNGFKIIVPLLNILNKISRRKIIYIVIGGFLPELLEKNRKYIRILKTYDRLFVQTKGIMEKLGKFGITNVSILSNLKNMKCRDIHGISIINNKCIKVCTLSRVRNDKGILDAIEAVKLINDSHGNIIKLDIYGIVDEAFKEIFFEKINRYSYVEYKGVVKYNETVDILKEYFCLLFPTFYYGEGFAGNIIDAYYAGIPIIATDWMHNSEIIVNYVNGLLVEVNNPNDIASKILELYNNRALHYDISINNINESYKYKVENVMSELLSFLGT